MSPPLIKRLNQILGRVRGVVRRGVLNSVNAGSGRQLLQVDVMGDGDDDVEHLEPYGFTSNPPKGSDVLVLSVGADRAHPVAVLAGTGSGRKSGLEAGEVAIYHQDGAFVVLKADGSVEAESKGGAKLTLNADGSIDATPAAGMTANIGGAADFIALAQKVEQNLQENKIWMDTHVHVHPMGNTLAPVALSPTPSPVGAQNAKAQ